MTTTPLLPRLSPDFFIQLAKLHAAVVEARGRRAEPEYVHIARVTAAREAEDEFLRNHAAALLRLRPSLPHQPDLKSEEDKK